MTYQRGTVEQDGRTIVLEPEIYRHAYKGGATETRTWTWEESHLPQRWGWQHITDEQGRAHLKLVSVEKSHDYVLVTQ